MKKYTVLAISKRRFRVKVAGSAAILVLLFLICFPIFTFSQRGNPVYAITNVSVIDVVSGKVMTRMTVVIKGNKITRIEHGKVPGNAKVIEGEGKFLIPGLWDMHAHFFNDPFTAVVSTPLLLANGVTGIRDMSGPLNKIIPWRDSVRSGLLVGPRAFVAGPIIDGPPPATEGDILVFTPEQGRKAVDSLAAAHVDFIKVYEMLRPDVFLAIIDQAKKYGLVAAGHIPMSVDANMASDAGMKSFEHLRNLELACSTKSDSLRLARIAALDSGINSNGRVLRGRILSKQRIVALKTIDPVLCGKLIAKLKKNNTWQTPTLFLDEVALSFFDSSRMKRVRSYEQYMSKDYREWWQSQATSFQKLPDSVVKFPKEYALWQRGFVLQLQKAGVKILAGSDYPNLLTAAGFGLYEELLSLKNAGLSNLEVLQTATINPALYFNIQDSMGTIKKGNIADLILLDKNPLEKIENLQTIHSVFVNGTFLDRAALDAMLNKVKRIAEKM